MTEPIHPNPAPPPYVPHTDAGAYVPPPNGGAYPPYAYLWAPPPPRSTGGEGKRMFEAATIGVYHSDTDVTSKLVVSAVRTAKVPHDARSSPSDITAELLHFTGSTVAERQPGPHGASSRCGYTSVSGFEATACAWSDSATTGMLVSVDDPVNPERLSAAELALRDRID